MKFMRMSTLALGLPAVAVALAFSLSVPAEAKPTKKAKEAVSEPIKDVPTFTLAWSEYPSWSVFGVAHEQRLINGKKGKLGKLERKWGVDIELKLADYDACLTMYGSGATDAVCITNMDILNPSLSRKAVAILPTSTSKGADALIVPKSITKIQDLKGKKVYGLAKSVSEYCFVRNLELLGEKERDYKFTNRDPGAAATAMQQGDKNVEAIVVWNPFVLSTLEKRKDVHVLFDSSKIPEEIIDMVAVAEASLKKPGGAAFAHCVIDTFYEICNRMADAKKSDKTLVALGKKFSNLGLEAMKKVVTQTAFYKSPKEGIGLFESDRLPKIMKRVVGFCSSHEMIDKGKTCNVGYGEKAKEINIFNLRFDASYIKAVHAKNKK